MSMLTSNQLLEVLQGEKVLLAPMTESHRSGLMDVLQNPQIWEFTWRRITTAEQVDQLIDTALMNKENGTELPFTMIEKSTGRIIGTTRLFLKEAQHRNAEIGCTWISPDYWRTKVNTEAKSLLLHYVFEQLAYLRVQFSVSGYNLRSQQAVERLGAVKEGVLRKNRIKTDGTIHDNVIFSILDTEWPAVKENLNYLLNVKYS
ncbi:GNAT family N-acetyltransferase [Paenibacillus albidus]|uniref:GNAT family N-acetyltransferase n=1 Tax=Paenibacillus albidus TaxID=2041023 RepID=UPI00203601C8|nr:GNAT family protein [Paenibacillus albidus]